MASVETLAVVSRARVAARVRAGVNTMALLEVRPRTRRAPDTKRGPLVKDMRIKSLEIYLFSLPIKESEIIVFFLGTSLKDEVLKTMPMQKQICAGQWTRFKVFVVTGDYNRHVSLGVRGSKKVPLLSRS